MSAAEFDGAPVTPAPPARNSLFILAARLLELGASVGIAALVARHLGVAGYGRYALVVAFVMLFGQFISFGLEHIIIREVARAPGRLRELLEAGMTLELGLGALVIPLTLAASLLVGFAPGDGRGVLVFGVAFFLRAFYEVVYRSTFIACGAARYETALTLFFQTLRLALVGAVVYAGGGVVAVLGAVLAAEAANAAAAYALLRWKLAPLRPSWNRPTLVYLLAQAWPIATVGILNNVYVQQDALLLKWLLGDYREIGYFAAAYRLVTFFIFLSVPMLWPLLPEFSRRAGTGVAELVAGARRAARLALFIVLPAGVMAAWFAPELIKFIFGAPYLPAASALALLAVTMVARPLGYIADASLIAAGRQRYLAVVAGVIVATNFALDVILIPRLGFMGAAWGTVVADIAGLFAAALLTGVLFRKSLVDRGALTPVALATAIGAGLYLAAPLPRAASAAGALAAFVLGTAAFIGKEDRRKLAAALGLNR